jgi:hypothetical protein
MRAINAGFLIFKFMEESPPFSVVGSQGQSSVTGYQLVKPKSKHPFYL